MIERHQDMRTIKKYAHCLDPTKSPNDINPNIMFKTKNLQLLTLNLRQNFVYASSRIGPNYVE